MNCSEAQDRWHRRLESAAADDALEAHLATCEQCRQYGTQMRHVVAALEELQRETEAVTSTPRVGVGNAQPAVPRRRTGWWIGAAAAIAAALFVAVGLTRWWISNDSTVGPQIAARQEAAVEEPVAVEAPQTPEPARPVEPRLGITLQGDSAKRYLAVARPTSQPNVQVYWLYPLLGASEETNGS